MHWPIRYGFSVDAADYEAQLAALESDIQPQGAVECEFVRQLADAQWRMQRLARLETAYLNAALDNTRQVEAGLHRRQLHYSDEENTLMLGYSLTHRTPSLGHFARYDAHLSRRFERALQQIAKLRESRQKTRPIAHRKRPPHTRRFSGSRRPGPARRRTNSGLRSLRNKPSFVQPKWNQQDSVHQPP